MAEHVQKFNSLGRFVPEVMDSENLKMMWFEEQLLTRVQARLSLVTSRDYADAYQKSIRIEARICKRDTKRGFKRPRPFGNQSQGQSSRGSTSVD